ncbi:glycosyltransferase [Rhizobium sp. 9140]|uniref:glycosyltransferase n=1 Tax=Rhizobium sp. 9140 TaxID=1761900 RepID=UPI00079BA2DC|nr:glycosyltransferase [Rhizobium sp. 9140]CZT37349.1 Glycosyltransferase involved in cell wall bisynthesis [Rhizobium sp. 9140]
MLDLEFYKQYNSLGYDLTDTDLQRHWESTGYPSGLYSSPEDALRKLSALPDLPPNFDVFTYLELNKDVAESIQWPFEGIIHFLDYGQKENRRYSYNVRDTQRSIKIDNEDVRDIGEPVHERLDYDMNLLDTQFRLLNDTQRDSWVEAVTTLLETKSIRQLRHHHPRGAMLNSSFNIISYMVKNPDIAEATKHDPFLALVHFLEFGIEEGRSGDPTHVDSAFIASYYDLELPNDIRASDVVPLLRKKRPSEDDAYFLSEEEWAIYNKIDERQFLDLFDHEYYRCKVQDKEFLSHDRWTCIDHFWRIGRFSSIDISYEMRFDADYYGSVYHANLAERMPSPSVLYADWLHNGIKRDYSPNLGAWLSSRVNVALPEDFETALSLYALNAGLVSQTLNDIATHMLTAGHPAIVEIKIDSPSMGLFMAKVADRYALGGNPQLADRIYQNVSSSMPMLSKVLQHQSDQLERAGYIGSAVALREKAISEGSEDIWSYLTLSTSYKALGQPDQATKILASASLKFPGDVNIRKLKQAQARSLFESSWDGAPSRALIRGYKATQSEIALQLDLCTERTVSCENRSATIQRVALVASYDIAQCKLYRVNQKLQQLAHAGLTVKAFGYNTELSNFVSEVGNYDAVIFFRVPGFPSVIDAITLVNDMGIPSFYDIDDLIFDENEFPPPLSTYAGAITAEQHAEIACGVPLFRHAMSLCDYGIVSTPTLASLVAKHVRTGLVSVHPNGLGHEHYTALARPTSNRQPDDVCRVFYGSGTKAHKEDFYDILEPALVRLAYEFSGRVHIYLLGYFEWTEKLQSIRKHVTMMPPVWDVGLYWEILSKMDINLAVLSNSVVNNAKSEIKWLEAAMFGIPSIVSRTDTHAKVIKHGATGYLCNTTEDFYNTLELLVNDRNLRSAVGAAANSVATEQYGIPTLSVNLKTILDSATVPKKKRLLIVNVFYPPQSIGGATRVVRDNVLDLLAKYGDEFEIDIICTLEGGKDPYSHEVYSIDGVRVFAVTAPSEPDIDSNPVHTKMGEAFSNLLDVIRPDMIHFHCIQRLTASAVNTTYDRKIPYVITAHDGWWISDKQFLLDENDKVKLYEYQTADDLIGGFSAGINSRAALLRKALFGAQHVLAISDAFSKIYKQAGVPNVLTISNGAPTVTALPKKPSDRGRVRLAHIGGMERHKGFHLVKYGLMSNQLENVELLVIDATLPSGVERTEVWGKTKVTFRGRTKQENIGELYSEIDVLLAPSVWPEGFGLVTREALACGCWVVASDRGAVGADVTDGENGFIIDVSTVGPISEVLHKIDGDKTKYSKPPAHRITLRKASSQADELAALYRRVIADPTK